MNKAAKGKSVDIFIAIEASSPQRVRTGDFGEYGLVNS